MLKAPSVEDSFSGERQMRAQLRTQVFHTFTEMPKTSTGTKFSVDIAEDLQRLIMFGKSYEWIAMRFECNTGIATLQLHHSVALQVIEAKTHNLPNWAWEEQHGFPRLREAIFASINLALSGPHPVNSRVQVCVRSPVFIAASPIGPYVMIYWKSLLISGLAAVDFPEIPPTK